MIGNSFDMVNCYGLMFHMTFYQQGYNLDYVQHVSVNMHPNHNSYTQPVNTHWFSFSSILLSVGFVIAMDMLLEFDSKNEIDCIQIHDLFPY